MANSKKKRNLLAEMQNEMSSAVSQIATTDQSNSEKNPEQKQVVAAKPRKSLQNVPWYPPNDRVKKELKQLAFDEETTMSKLLTEGLDLLFKSRGKASIEELK